MLYTGASHAPRIDPPVRGGIAAVSAALLMTEFALTRNFLVMVYYHFAFLVISTALLGLSASGVCVSITRRALGPSDTRPLLASRTLLHNAAATSAPASCESASGSITRRTMWR